MEDSQRGEKADDVASTSDNGAPSEPNDPSAPAASPADGQGPQDTAECVRQCFDRDPIAADFHASMFWSAMTSYRHDSVLRPFPPAFLRQSQSEGESEGEGGGGGGGEGGGEEGRSVTGVGRGGEATKDIDELRRVFEALPPLDQVIHPSHARGGGGGGGGGIDPRAMGLLKWLFTHNKSLTLRYQPLTRFTEIIGSSSNSSSKRGAVEPQFIFELVYGAESEARFQQLAAPHGTFTAYHGSRVENFFSIIHNGLLSHMNKTAVFGEGTYLSSDLQVCLNFSPTAQVWPHSLLPPLASCVAVCEIINHPDVQSRVQQGGEPSLSQRVPDRYYIITNNEHVRVKYVFVFGKRKTLRISDSWIMKHKFLLIIVFYAVLLLLLGIIRSKEFRYFTKKYFPKWS